MNCSMDHNFYVILNLSGQVKNHQHHNISIRNESRNYVISNKEHKGNITLINMEKYSCLNKLYSVTAFVYRFIVI